MSYRYTDVKIPHRKTRGGKSSRSVFDADRTGRWKIVTQEELFTGSRHDAHTPQDGSGRPAAPEGSLKKILGKAKDRGIPVSYADRTSMDRIAGGQVHQGVIAYASDYEYSSVEDLGAIMRTAECAGAHGVIIPERRSVSVNETVMKTSAGAAQYIGCAKVTNMGRTIDQLKERGVWVYGCDMDGSSCFETDLTGPAAIVIGNEGKGISRLVREKCDFIVSIPMKGQINSLNASNAAAIVTYEAVRQRGIR